MIHLCKNQLHEMTERNTQYAGGVPRCRACLYARQREYRARLKAAYAASKDAA